MSELARVLDSGDGELAIAPELIDAARDFAKNSKAASTIQKYRGDWQRFAAWCATRQLDALPATPATVALYATALATSSKKVTTIARALVSISQAHKAAGHASPVSSAAVHEVMRGIKRKLGVARTKKSPVLIDDLRRFVGKFSKTTSGLRNRALLVVGFAGALRRAELVALDVSDVRFTREGLEVTIRRSKTDQEGAGQKIGLPFGNHVETCPVRTLEAWLTVSAIKEGAIFRSCSSRGKIGPRLSDRDVARIVKKACLACGFDPTLYAGHSLRRGFATTAARAGKTERDIMRQTRHRSPMMVREYIEDAGIFEDNPASGIGL